MNPKAFSNSGNPSWRTPPWFFSTAEEYHKISFTLDAMASAENALCADFIDEKADLFKTVRKAHHVFFNPPERLQAAAVQRAIELCRTDVWGTATGLFRAGHETHAFELAFCHGRLIELIKPRLNYLGPGEQALTIAKAANVPHIKCGRVIAIKAKRGGIKVMMKLPKGYETADGWLLKKYEASSLMLNVAQLPWPHANIFVLGSSIAKPSWLVFIDGKKRRKPAEIRLMQYREGHEPYEIKWGKT